MATKWQSLEEVNVQLLDTALKTRVNELKSESVNLSDPDIKLSEFRVYQKQVNRNVSSSISVAPYFKGDGEYDDLEFRYFAGAFSDRHRFTKGTDTSIIAERFGLGIQIDLKVTQIKSAINLGFGMIAAAVEMGLAEANYSYKIYALPSGEFHDTLPKVGRFNQQSIKQFQKLVNKLKELYSKSLTNLELSAIGVLTSDSIKEDGTENAPSYYFAARRIIEAMSLRDAIKLSRRRSEPYNEDAIQYLYGRCGITGLEEKPISSNISKAKKIILE
ncbi:hypothetical protein L0P88_21640 [Muricauda sp. SCSIO 64092]|uniref:hypothetical protein n=1 Tax=Allomuricauda sp. SCSIO 64092 TaxID=2908842 RepID=UPI001FF696D9|nr:hypothetical protein [Muricauda sp. SCSIO 64092]UOY06514.1 hypothetical protein L0P88_21640 [Muricauda sp. SCSIO 64092]